MDQDHDHTHDLCKKDFKVGDKVYCDKKQMFGFVTRLNPLGCEKMFAIGVHWENNQRDIIFGKDECCRIFQTKK